MTSLGLLKTLIGREPSPVASFYMRLSNELADIKTVKQVCPEAMLLEDTPQNLGTWPSLNSTQLVETHLGILSLRDGMPQAHKLSPFLQSGGSSTAILVSAAAPASPSSSVGAHDFSSTLLAYESLLNRDFDVSAIVCYSPNPKTSSLYHDLSRFVNIPILNIARPRELKNDPLLDYTNAMVWLEENEIKFQKLAQHTGILL